MFKPYTSSAEPEMNHNTAKQSCPGMSWYLIDIYDAGFDAVTLPLDWVDEVTIFSLDSISNSSFSLSRRSIASQFSMASAISWRFVDFSCLASVLILFRGSCLVKENIVGIASSVRIFFVGKPSNSFCKINKEYKNNIPTWNYFSQIIILVFHIRGINLQ